MSTRPNALRTGAVRSLDDPLLFAPTGVIFKDREDAGRRLAALLEQFRDEHPVIVGIPRGGVPVAAAVARALDAPLDVAVVRKIGAPQNPEYGLGALAEGGVQVLSKETVRAVGLTQDEVQALIARVERELDERTRRYRGTRAPTDLTGRTAILVDDGLATGRSAQAALQSLHKRGAARVILAVPVAAAQSVHELRGQADEVVCVEMPDDLWAVGFWYEDFAPTTDEEVTKLLAEHAETSAPPPMTAPPERSAPPPMTAPPETSAPPERSAPPSAGNPPLSREVTIPIDPQVSLSGDLNIPADALAIVAFAHGSGSSRLSPRNRAVARALNDAGYGTLLFDLLTDREELDRTNVFDIPLLASRLVSASVWLTQQSVAAALPLAYFGASTGAAAALDAAAELGERVFAVISRGGRPDLAANLAAVRTPTLLIVGGFDYEVLELNRDAQRQLRCPSELAVVPGATHLFEEPGALEEVSRLAIDWLERQRASAQPVNQRPASHGQAPR